MTFLAAKGLVFLKLVSATMLSLIHYYETKAPSGRLINCRKNGVTDTYVIQSYF